MKSLVQKLDVIGLVFFLFGFGFKFTHWPGSNIILFLGCLFCAVPLILKIKNSKSIIEKSFYLVLILFVILTVSWTNSNIITLRIIHWILLMVLLIVKMIILLHRSESLDATIHSVEKKLIILLFSTAITFCLSFGFYLFFDTENVVFIFWLSLFLAAATIRFYFKNKLLFEHLSFLTIKVDTIKLGIFIFLIFSIQQSYWNKIFKSAVNSSFLNYEQLEIENEKFRSDTLFLNTKSDSPEIQKMATEINSSVLKELIKIQEFKIELLDYYDEREYQIHENKNFGYNVEIQDLKKPLQFTNEFFYDLERSGKIESTLRDFSVGISKRINKYDFQGNSLKVHMDSSTLFHVNTSIRNTLLTNLSLFKICNQQFTIQYSRNLFENSYESHYSKIFYNLPMISALEKLSEIENKLLKLRSETLVFLSIQNNLTKK
jgi:hypothetical protein